MEDEAFEKYFKTTGAFENPFVPRNTKGWMESAFNAGRAAEHEAIVKAIHCYQSLSKNHE